MAAKPGHGCKMSISCSTPGCPDLVCALLGLQTRPIPWQFQALQLCSLFLHSTARHGRQGLACMSISSLSVSLLFTLVCFISYPTIHPPPSPSSPSLSLPVTVFSFCPFTLLCLLSPFPSAVAEWCWVTFSDSSAAGGSFGRAPVPFQSVRDAPQQIVTLRRNVSWQPACKPFNSPDLGQVFSIFFLWLIPHSFHSPLASRGENKTISHFTPVRRRRRGTRRLLSYCTDYAYYCPSSLLQYLSDF